MIDKFKIEANAKVLKARSTIVSDIPQFWFTALINCTSIVPYLDPVDREALQHLTDVSIDHSTTDPRDFTLTFVRSCLLSLSLSSRSECLLL